MHHAINNVNSNADVSFELEALLIRYGVKITSLDVRNRIPLHYAFIKIGKRNISKHIDPIETVTSLLSSKKFDVNIQGFLLFFYIF